MATKKQQANALITQYVQLYSDKHGQAPNINRYKDIWGFEAMIADLGYERAVQVLQYWVEKNHKLPLVNLFRSYDTIHALMLEIDADRENRAKLRRETKERLDNWQRMNST